MYVPFRLIEGCGGYRRWGGLGATKTGLPPIQCMQCLSKSTHFSPHGFLESYHTLVYVSRPTMRQVPIPVLIHHVKILVQG